MIRSRRPSLPLVLSAGLAALVVAALPQRGFSGPAAQAGSTTPTIGEALRPSSTEQEALSDWLRQRGAIFYGAWWCPACFQQKNLFGKQAGNRLPYVECDKDDPGRKRCSASHSSGKRSATARTAQWCSVITSRSPSATETSAR